MNRKQLVTCLPDLINYYDKLEKYEEQLLARQERHKEIQEAILAGKKPPRKLPKQDIFLKGEGKPEYPVIEDMEDFSRKERILLEKKTLGLYLTGHPLDDYPHLINSYEFDISDIVTGQTGSMKNISFPAVISSLTKKCSKNKKNYAILTLEDTSGRIEATVFPKTWNKLESKVEEDLIVIARGKIECIEQDNEESDPIVKFILNDVSKPNLESMSLESLYYRLSDGTNIKFQPHDKSILSKWIAGRNYLKGI